MTSPARAPLPRRSGRRFPASLRAIGALVLRELTTVYGRSPGGYLWAVAEPVAGIALLSFIFSLGFQAPALGRNFPLFYATGLMPFLVYGTISGRVATALLFSRSLMAYPAVTHVDAILARFLLNAGTQLVVAGIIFGGILVVFDTGALISPGPLAQGFVLVAALALGIGTLNCYLFTRFPTWQTIWSILMRPLFLVSGVFFVLEAVPQPWRDILWWNPLVHVVGLVRRGFYPGYGADYVSVPYIAAVAMIAFLAGLLALHRTARDLVHD